MISTLQRLAGIGTNIVDHSASAINFNANLPITIEVLKQLGHDRFKLKLGRKELTTKSQKNLKEGKKYWGNFFQGKGGILTISNLYPQPSLFQSDDNFLPLSLDTLLTPHFSMENWKAFLIHHLSDENTHKELFSALSIMLLALSKGIVHLPLFIKEKKMLLQFAGAEKNITFYVAFENLGPIQGRLSLSNHDVKAYLEVAYEKTLYFLQKEMHKLGIITELSLCNEIQPLFDSNDLLLDLKG